jgi:hypothetical protein
VFAQRDLIRDYLVHSCSGCAETQGSGLVSLVENDMNVEYTACSYPNSMVLKLVVD